MSGSRTRSRERHGLVRKTDDALENTRIRSCDLIFVRMLITRCVKGQTGRAAYRVVRGHDATAPVAEFGEKIRNITSKTASKSRPRMHAKFHYGICLELSMKSDESIIGTPNRVIKTKKPQDQRWRDEELLHTKCFGSSITLRGDFVCAFTPVVERDVAVSHDFDDRRTWLLR